MNRRKFIKSTGIAATAPLIFTKARLFGAEAASSKLNLALIGGHAALGRHLRREHRRPL